MTANQAACRSGTQAKSDSTATSSDRHRRSGSGTVRYARAIASQRTASGFRPGSRMRWRRCRTACRPSGTVCRQAGPTAQTASERRDRRPRRERGGRGRSTDSLGDLELRILAKFFAHVLRRAVEKMGRSLGKILRIDPARPRSAPNRDDARSYARTPRPARGPAN